MLWFWGALSVCALVVIAGRAHSRYLDRLDEERDRDLFIVLWKPENAGNLHDAGFRPDRPSRQQ